MEAWGGAYYKGRCLTPTPAHGPTPQASQPTLSSHTTANNARRACCRPRRACCWATAAGGKSPPKLWRPGTC